MRRMRRGVKNCDWPELARVVVHRTLRGTARRRAGPASPARRRSSRCCCAAGRRRGSRRRIRRKSQSTSRIGSQNDQRITNWWRLPMKTRCAGSWRVILMPLTKSVSSVSSISSTAVSRRRTGRRRRCRRRAPWSPARSRCAGRRRSRDCVSCVTTRSRGTSRASRRSTSALSSVEPSLTTMIS